MGTPPHRASRRGGVVDQRRQSHISRRVDQRPLPDREARVRPTPSRPGSLLGGCDGRPRAPSRRPALAVPADVLALVLADRAVRRRLLRRGELPAPQVAQNQAGTARTLAARARAEAVLEPRDGERGEITRVERRPQVVHDEPPVPRRAGRPGRCRRSSRQCPRTSIIGNQEREPPDPSSARTSNSPRSPASRGALAAPLSQGPLRGRRHGADRPCERRRRRRCRACRLEARPRGRGARASRRARRAPARPRVPAGHR